MNDMETTIVTTLSILLAQLPIFLVWLIGIILSFFYWKRHPKVSLFALIAFLGFTCMLIITSVFNSIMPRLMAEIGTRNVSTYYTVYGFVSSFFSMIFWGLLLAALFGWRKPNVDAASRRV